MRRLDAFLREGLDDANKKGISLNRTKHARLLNMACGRADETEVLNKLLLEKSESTELIGVDLRHREIEMAQTRWTNLGEKSDAQFLNFDATKLNEHQSLQDKNDIAFFRHQNFWNGPKIWREIFENSIDTVKEDGLIMITSYFDKEHELAVKELTDQGLELVSDIKNEQSRLILPSCEKSVDRHLAIFKKR